MKHLLVLSMIFLCLMVFVTNAQVRANDNATVIGAFRHLSALRSFRETSSYVLLGHEETICREWRKTPPQLRTSSGIKDYASDVIVARTRALTYMHIPNKPLKTWKTRYSDKMYLRNGIDYRRELDLGRCDFTYRGLAQFQGTQCRCYTFRGRSGNHITPLGRVLIGVADDLPRRLESASRDIGPYRTVWDNFNVPIATGFATDK